MKQQKNEVKQFWEGYRKAVVDEGVSEKKADWYVHWAMAFAVSIKGRPLRAREGADVEGFLTALAAEKNVRSWQVQEAYHALQVLYRGFLNLPLDFPNPAEADASVTKARIHGHKAN